MNTPYPYPDLPRPAKQGLYDPRFEHDACGVGLVADIKGRKSNDIIKKGLEALINLGHRGAAGADPETGDGAGLLIQMPHEFFTKEADVARLRPPGVWAAMALAQSSCRRTPARGEGAFASSSERSRDEGCRLLGWRDVPTRPRRHRRAVPRGHAGHPAVLRRPPGGRR